MQNDGSGGGAEEFLGLFEDADDVEAILTVGERGGTVFDAFHEVLHLKCDCAGGNELACLPTLLSNRAHPDPVLIV